MKGMFLRRGYPKPFVPFVVTFNGNGGTASSVSVETNRDGTLVSIPSASRNNYIFTGWFTAASGGTQITENTVFTKDTTVYAQWTNKATITVTGKGSRDYCYITIGGSKTYNATTKEATIGSTITCHIGVLSASWNRGYVILNGRTVWNTNMPESDGGSDYSYKVTKNATINLTYKYDETYEIRITEE